MTCALGGEPLTQILKVRFPLQSARRTCGCLSRAYLFTLGKTRPWFQSSTKVYDAYSDKDVYVVSMWRRLGCVVMSIVALMPIITCTVLAHMGIFT